MAGSAVNAPIAAIFSVGDGRVRNREMPPPKFCAHAGRTEAIGTGGMRCGGCITVLVGMMLPGVAAGTMGCGVGSGGSVRVDKIGCIGRFLGRTSSASRRFLASLRAEDASLSRGAVLKLRKKMIFF
jgi:hypothetical protein